MHTPLPQPHSCCTGLASDAATSLLRALVLRGMGRPKTALCLSTLSRTWPLPGEWLVSQEHTVGGEPMHDSLCPALGPPLPKPPGCLSPVLGPAPQGGVGVCLAVDLVLLLPGATSQGSQAPQASRQAPDSQLLEAGPSCILRWPWFPALFSPHFPACCPSHTELCPGPNWPQVTYLQGSLSSPSLGPSCPHPPPSSGQLHTPEASLTPGSHP